MEFDREAWGVRKGMERQGMLPAAFWDIGEVD